MNKKLAEWKATVTSIASENKVKRSKKEKRTLPKAKGSVKGVRVLVWSMIVVICLTGVLGFARAQNALHKSKEAKAAVNEIKNNPNADQDAYSSPKLMNFGNEVVKAYVPISPKADDRTKQMAELEKYYAKDVPLPQLGDFQGHRDLKGFELFNITHEAHGSVLQYKVSYTNVASGEQPKDDEKKEEDKDAKPAPETKTDKEALLNIPAKSVKNGFVVIESPYFSAVPTLIGKKVEAVSSSYTDDTLVQTTKSEPIQKWLTESFFPKYASETKAEMMYMMEKPEALNGVQEFQEIKSIKVYPGKKKNQYVAKVVAAFKEKELEVSQDSTFTITLKDSDNKYFVEKLTHTLGGK